MRDEGNGEQPCMCRLCDSSNFVGTSALQPHTSSQAPLVHPGEPFQEAVPNNNPQAHAVPHKHGPWIRLPQLACAIVVLTCECRSVALGTQAILSEHLVAMAQASSRHPVFTRHDTGREDNACRGHSTASPKDSLLGTSFVRTCIYLHQVPACDKSCVINDMKLIFSWDRGTQAETRTSSSAQC